MSNRTLNITTAYQLFQFIRFGFLLLISIFLAWIFSDKTIIGHYEKFLLLSGSITSFWVAGLLNGMIPLIKGELSGHKESVLKQNFVLGIALGIVSGIIAYCLSRVIYPELPKDALFYFAAFVSLYSGTFLLEYYLLIKEKAITLILYGFGIYSLHFAAVVIPLWLGEGLQMAMLWLFLVSLIRLILLFAFAGKDLVKGKLDKNLILSQLNVSWPLILAAFFGGGAMYVDSYIVSKYFSNDSFALFTYGAKELPVLVLMANALSTVKSGEIAENANKNGIGSALADLKSRSLRLMHLFFPASIILIFISSHLFTFIFGEGFKNASFIFDIYLLLIIPRLIFPQAILKGFLKTKILMNITLIELLLNVGLSLWWMQYWGIQGIAMATVAAFVFEKLVLMIYCKKSLNIGMGTYHNFGIWGIYMMALLVVFFFKYWPFTLWGGI